MSHPVLCQVARVRLSVLLSLAVTCMLLSVGLFGQITSGSISGSVKDASGAYVSGATVTVLSGTMGITRTVTTNSSGAFVFPNLPPATYDITVEAKGFKRLETKGVNLSAADKLGLGDLTLALGATTEQVTVTADAGQLQLQSSSAERSDLITSKQLNDVALNGRMVLDYVKLIPGVTSWFDGSASTTWGLGAFSVNGTRPNQKEFTIDGASNVDTGYNGGGHVTLNPDAVSEMKVLTSNYQAEFGKAAGGQVNLTTKSGTTAFHGNARFFHRHEQFNANSWFANLAGKDAQGNDIVPRPLYRFNYAGYQVGGPVLLPGTKFNKQRDKMYFFWGQEFYRQLVPAGGVTPIRVPTNLERQGDFSQTLDANGAQIVIYDPATGQPFPGNKIDRAQLNPAQQQVFDEISKVMSLYVQPNITGNAGYNYATQLSYDNPRREDILRVDYQINSKNRIFTRWIHNADDAVLPMETNQLNCMGLLQIPGGCTNTGRSWNLSLNLLTTFTPTVLNEFSFGPSVERSHIEGTNGNLTVGKNNIHLPLLYNVSSDTSIPDIGFQDPIGTMKFPWSYFGANPWFQANTTINLNDNLTWVKGNHALKFGVFYQRSRKDQIGWGNSNGQFSFNSCPTSSDPTGCSDDATGFAYASALLGEFSSFGQSSTRPIGYFRYNQLEFYAQDTWKVFPRLTLDYGMRFAWIPPQYDAKNQVAIFNPSLYDPAQAVRLYTPAVGGGVYDPANPNVVIPDPNGVLKGTIIPNSGNLTNGEAFAADGYPRGGWDSNGIIPEPRVGFAYELTGDHKTVLRGGFGTSHDRMQGNLVFNPVFSNPRNVITPTVYRNNITNLPNLQSGGILTPLGNVVGAQKNGKVPVVYSFSLGVQRELGRGTTLDVAYVGTLGRHLVTARNINQIPYLTAFTAAAQDPAKFGGPVPAVEPDLADAYAQAGFSYSGNYAYDAPFVVPYRGYSTIEYYKFDGTSNYNSLQTSIQRRFSRGLTLGAVYTFSKVLTTASGDEDLTDTFLSRRMDYRLANFDSPHVVAINYVYDLPNVTKHFSGPKWLSYITDNFQLSGVTQFMSGYPIDPGIWWPPAQNISGTYSGDAIGWQRAWVYPLVVKDPNHRVGTSRWDPSAFQPPNLGIPVTASRSNLWAGGIQNWDMSIFKNIPLGSNEQRYIQLRLEAFNVFNHPNFDQIQMNWWMNPPSGSTPAQIVFPTRGSADCGSDQLPGACFGEYNSQHTGVGGPRVLQLAAKFYF